jgi:lipopolysaccharide assembly LptE-like protein
MRPPIRASAVALAAVALAVVAIGCGYSFSQRYVATGGIDRIHVRTFENRSADPALGASVTAALREELARRGAAAGEGAPAWLEGDVRTGEAVPSTTAAATLHVTLEVRARLVVGGQTKAERTIRRDTDHLGGADALETEGRRAVALRRLASAAAIELLRSLE